MSELAFNANGEAFDVPASVTSWRVRRMKPRGAPELVYGPDGRPLMVPIETTIDELRDAVGTAGKYRLDPINDDGKCVDAVPPAYVQVLRQARNAEPSALSVTSGNDETIREAMRLNAEMARSVIDRFADVITSAAELIRAADGAGIPARVPRVTDVEGENEADDENVPAETSPTFELVQMLVAQIAPVLVSSLATKLPSLGEMLDWRKASESGKASAEPVPAASASPTTAATPSTAEIPALNPATMAKVVAIQSALTPDEAARARKLAAELSPAELRAWFSELSALTTPDAVAKIRSLVGSTSKVGGVA